MTGDGSGDDRDREKDTRESRFADLMGDARPIARGPRRVEPPTRDPKTVRARRSAATTKNTRETAPEFRWPDPDEKGRAAVSGVNDAQLAALGRGEPEPEERIDLHGVRHEAAGRLLTQRIESAHTRGLRSLLVIHGRGRRSATGEAVLRDAIPGWLSQGANAKHVLAFTPAPDRLGGKGATLVLLRRRIG